MINFDLYKVFYYVAYTGSITKAANKLYVSQPDVSKQIKKLENILNTKLIYKSSKGISLTSTGQNLYQKIKIPIESLLIIEQEKFTQNISIASGLFVMKKIILPFASVFMNTYNDYYLSIYNFNFQEAIEKLNNGEIDLLIINQEHLKNKEDYVIIPLCVLNNIFICSNNLKNDFTEINDINNIPIFYKSNDVDIINFKSENFVFKNYKPKYELSSYLLIEENVKMKFGIGIMAKEFIHDDLKNGTLKQIQSKEKLKRKELVVILKKDNIKYQNIIFIANSLSSFIASHNL